MAQNRFYSNTAVTTSLSSGINNSVTTMVVGATTGFPGSFPYTLAVDPDTASEELVKVTAAVGTSLTVVRGQDGTAATTHASAAVVKHVVSAQDFSEPQTHIGASASVHGLSGGTVVGTTETQTLTNKTLTAPAMTAPTASGSLSGFGGAWSTFATVWTANGSTITQTAGSFFRYLQIGKLVIAQFSLSANSTATAGTDWQITLAVAPRSNTPVTVLGQASATSNNAGWHTGDGHLVGSIMKLFRPATSTYMSGAVAVGDQWYGMLVYEAA